MPLERRSRNKDVRMRIACSIAYRVGRSKFHRVENGSMMIILWCSYPQNERPWWWLRWSKAVVQSRRRD